MKVTKRDGRTEDFVIEKVVVSMVKSGAPADFAREIAKNIEAEVREGVSTRDIRRRVLEELRKKNPDWEENWNLITKSIKRVK